MRISYKPLRDYLLTQGRVVSYLRTEGIINSNVATAINNDDEIRLGRIVCICEFLNVPIDQVVEVVPNSAD